MNLSNLDLTGANFSNADIHGANFSRSILSGGKFHRADLHASKFADADLSDVDACYADLVVADLSRADLSRADLSHVLARGLGLSGAKLNGATLVDADLRHADLSGANLTEARLTGADLRRVDLSGADLRRVDLSGANLSGANLSGADLGGAVLSGADFAMVDLSHANLQNANLGGVNLADTNLVDLDLTPFCDAKPSVVHLGPSTIDFRSVIKSLRAPSLKAFLQRTGMPDIVVDYSISCADSLDGNSMKKLLRSTFISYGSPDEAFARKLYEALHRNGVTTFFFAEHAVPGEKLHHMMRKGVNEYDRIVLVCSKASLDRRGVLNEIEEALAREARDGGEAYLIPIRLDGYVFSEWTPKNPGTAQAVRDRVVADFEGAESDAAKFDEGILRLISALRK